MRETLAIACVALALTGCGRDATTPRAPVDAASAQNDATRAWLVKALTCGDPEFLRSDAELQRKHLSHMAGVTCEAGTEAGRNSAPLRCSVSPPLQLAQADIAWFVIGAPQDDLATIVLPAPPEALRSTIATGTGVLSAGTDLGDTTVQCALTEDALAPGAIAGTVHREGDPAAAVRVCAFELADDGVTTCTLTAQGERKYRIEGLARGDYLVLAIPGDAPDGRVGYTDCDVGDTTTPCTHELKVVAVRAGKTTEPIDLADLRTMEEAGDWPQPPPAD